MEATSGFCWFFKFVTLPLNDLFLFCWSTLGALATESKGLFYDKLEEEDDNENSIFSVLMKMEEEEESLFSGLMKMESDEENRRPLSSWG